MSIAEKPEIKNIDLHLLHNDAHFQRHHGKSGETGGTGEDSGGNN